MRIKITADSTCDLPRELAEQYGIYIFPLSVIIDGKALRDGIEIVPRDIFEHVARGGKLGSTAAVNVADYLERFTQFRKEYDAVIHFTISASMSACFQNANIAGEDLGKIYVVDSQNLSAGISLLVLKAVEMAASGADAEAIVAAVNALRDKVDTSFVIDTLNYLKAGGRCSPLVALGANLLSLKPCIEVKDGAMDVGKKYRGVIEKVVLKYLADRLAHPEELDHARAFMVSSEGFEPEFLDEAEAQIRSLCPFDELIRATAGCTISNHCGPKTLGIIMLR